MVSPERVVDPGGRDGCRAPLPWTRHAGHGWGPDPWLPFPPDAADRSAEALRADPTSILHLYRRLLTARRASPALQMGDLELLDAGPGGLAWRRRAHADERTVVVAFGAEPVSVDLPGIVEVASDGRGEDEPFSGTLDPDTAVLLRPLP